MTYELPNRTNEVLVHVDQTPIWFRILHYIYTAAVFFIIGATSFIYISLIKKGLLSITDIISVQLGEIFVLLMLAIVASLSTAVRNPSTLYKILSLIPLIILIAITCVIWYTPQLLAYFLMTMIS